MATSRPTGPTRMEALMMLIIIVVVSVFGTLLFTGAIPITP